MDFKDNLIAWKALLITSQTGNVSRTALMMNMDAPKVSRLLAGLEKELGYTLFDKSQRPFKPTYRCVQLLSLLEPILSDFKDLQDPKFGLEKKTLIRVAAPIEIALECYCDEYCQYMSNHPEIEFEVQPEVTAASVLNGETDVAMLNRLPEDVSELKIRQVSRSYTVPLATPQYLKFNGVPNTPEDLKHHRGLMLKTSTYPLTRFLQKEGESSSALRWKTQFFTHDQFMLKKLLLDHHGITVDLYVGHVAKELQEGKLVPILYGWHRAPWNMCIVTRREVDISNAEVRNFAQWWAEVEALKSQERLAKCLAMIQKLAPENVSPDLIR